MSKFTCKTCRHNVDEFDDRRLVDDWPCDTCENFNMWAPLKDLCQYCWGKGCHLCGKPEIAHLKDNNDQEVPVTRDNDIIDVAIDLFDGTSDASYDPNEYQIGVSPEESKYHMHYDEMPTHEPPKDMPDAIVLDADPDTEITLFPNDTKDHQISVDGIKDSGTRTEFETGAVRDGRTNKGRFDLLPIMAIFRLAKHYERGCIKYGDRNWEKGIPISKYIDSAIRHLLKHMAGFTEEHHLASALWNIAGCMETLDRISLGILPDSLDDMPCTFADVDYERFEEILDRLL